MYINQTFRTIKNIIPESVASTTLNTPTILSFTQYGGNFDVTVSCTTGIIYLSPLSTAPTSTNAFPLEEGEALELKVPLSLGLLGNSTTAAYKAIVWG